VLSPGQADAHAEFHGFWLRSCAIVLVPFGQGSMNLAMRLSGPGFRALVPRRALAAFKGRAQPYTSRVHTVAALCAAACHLQPVTSRRGFCGTASPSAFQQCKSLHSSTWRTRAIAAKDVQADVGVLVEGQPARLRWVIVCGARV
jgi:hypothetical protein